MNPVTLKPLLLVYRWHSLRHAMSLIPQMCDSQSTGAPTMRTVVMATKHGRQNVVTPGRLLMGDVQIHRRSQVSSDKPRHNPQISFVKSD